MSLPTEPILDTFTGSDEKPLAWWKAPPGDLTNYEFAGTVTFASPPLREGVTYGIRHLDGVTTFWRQEEGGQWEQVPEDDPEARAFNAALRPGAVDDFGSGT